MRECQIMKITINTQAEKEKEKGKEIHLHLQRYTYEKAIFKGGTFIVIKQNWNRLIEYKYVCVEPI